MEVIGYFPALSLNPHDEYYGKSGVVKYNLTTPLKFFV